MNIKNLINNFIKVEISKDKKTAIIIYNCKYADTIEFVD